MKCSMSLLYKGDDTRLSICALYKEETALNTFQKYYSSTRRAGKEYDTEQGKLVVRKVIYVTDCEI
jgi:hypothetical protein